MTSVKADKLQILQLHVSQPCHPGKSIPVSNSWPERGASAVKRTKTRLRNRLSDNMLSSLLHLSINAPHLSSDEPSPIIQEASKRFTAVKERRKLPNRKDMQGIATEVSVASIDQNQSRFELEARVQQLQDQLAVEMIHADHGTLKNMPSAVLQYWI